MAKHYKPIDFAPGIGFFIHMRREINTLKKELGDGLNYEAFEEYHREKGNHGNFIYYHGSVTSLILLVGCAAYTYFRMYK